MMAINLVPSASKLGVCNVVFTSGWFVDRGYSALHNQQINDETCIKMDKHSMPFGIV